MKSMFSRLLIAAGFALVVADAKRPSPATGESSENSKRTKKRKSERSFEDMRIQEEKFPEFDAVMKHHGFEWLPYEVVTED